MAVSYNREQLQAALANMDSTSSYYLDLHTGEVVTVSDTATDPESEQLRNQVMEGYGERYRYIPGGNAAADAAAVQTWLEAEGL